MSKGLAELDPRAQADPLDTFAAHCEAEALRYSRGEVEKAAASAFAALYSSATDEWATRPGIAGRDTGAAA